MLHSASPGRRAARALLVPVSGLALLAGVLPASAATAPVVSRVHSLRGLPSLPGFAELPGLGSAPLATTASVTVAGTTTVKTANGQSWTLSVGDSNSAGGLIIAIERTVSAGGTGAEEHLWQFKSKASSLTFSKTTGDGTIKGGLSTGKVATVSLTLKSTSHKAWHLLVRQRNDLHQHPVRRSRTGHRAHRRRDRGREAGDAEGGGDRRLRLRRQHKRLPRLHPV